MHEQFYKADFQLADNFSGLDRKSKGQSGEQFATMIYEANGFTIEQTDLRIGRNQVDLVASKTGVFHFVEVKFRQTLLDGHRAICAAQINRIASVAEKYMLDKTAYYQIDIFLIDRNMNWQRIDNFAREMHI